MVPVAVLLVIVVPGIFIMCERIFTGKINAKVRENDLAMGGAWLVAIAVPFFTLTITSIKLLLYLEPADRSPVHGIVVIVAAAYASYKFAEWIIKPKDS